MILNYTHVRITPAAVIQYQTVNIVQRSIILSSLWELLPPGEIYLNIHTLDYQSTLVHRCGMPTKNEMMYKTKAFCAKS